MRSTANQRIPGIVAEREADCTGTAGTGMVVEVVLVFVSVSVG